VKSGDIILVRGRAALSEGILKATNGHVSHAAAVIGTNPPICIEALTRVRTNPLHVTIGAAEAAYLVTDDSLTDAQREAIVYAALTFSAEDYNYIDLALQGLDSLAHSDWFTHILAHDFLDRWPICSYVVSKAYEKGIGRTFGKPADSITPEDLYVAGGAAPYRRLQLV
jgi:hypothetical protein